MPGKQQLHIHRLILLAFGVMLLALLACARTIGPARAPWNLSQDTPAPVLPVQASEAAAVPTVKNPDTPAGYPTPDSPRTLPPLRTEDEEYYVQAGDTLGKIAQRYGVTLEAVIEANDIDNPNLLDIGQYLVIPPPVPAGTGPDYKIIPDSELVYGPSSANFDIEGFIEQHGGYLASYIEEVDEEVTASGAQIVRRIAGEYSVNPRLLLAVLEYRSGWVTDPDPLEETLDFPLRVYDSWRDGLYRQLAYVADNLNRGYYLWRVNGVSNWIVGGEVILPAVTINAGTAAVQHLFSLLYDRVEWERAVTSEGLFATYEDLFGYPFDYTYEPLLPANLSQPVMTLPFEPGQQWSFTGGPHGGWGDGSAWAALDFAPPGDALGCVASDEWVVAAADGPVIRSEFGAVMQDIETDGNPSDGLEGTGWTLLYMHIESRDRVQAGVYLHAGDRIGHPSCEGGFSTGTHLHLARRFNGEWIPADQTLPFILDGWVSRGSGSVYNGFLEKDGNVVEAWEGRTAVNGISR